MTSTAIIHSRERLGWIFLIVGFIVFLVIAISIPLTVNAYLQNTKQPLPATVSANQGTVRIGDRSGLLRATSADDPPESVESGAEILTDATATALVLVNPPESDQILARLQVYGNSNLRLDAVDAPRYEISESEQRIVIRQQSGRLRLTVPEVGDEPLAVTVRVPQGEVVVLTPGQYSVEVTNAQAQIAIRSGRAEVRASGDSITLLPDQRVVLPTEGGLSGPLDSERNLIINGNFENSFERWTLFSWNVERADQPEGQMSILPISGESTLHIERLGQGHADARLRQSVNQDVTDYESLQLFATFRIVDHDLGVCGIRGSECPMFLRVNYVDDAGVTQTWQQGFYAVGEANTSGTPDACESCAVVQSRHQHVQLGQVYFYDVDMKAELARQGYLPPRIIESISIVASGHSFVVDVMDVALMVKE